MRVLKTEIYGQLGPIAAAKGDDRAVSSAGECSLEMDDELHIVRQHLLSAEVHSMLGIQRFFAEGQAFAKVSLLQGRGQGEDEHES